MSDHADELLGFAESLADESRVLLREAAGAALDVEIKADASVVTEWDRRIETRLRERIESRYPAHGILGEELGSSDLDAEFVWVLDPIDGTAPFIAGLPVYGTLIGVAHGGRPLVGVIDHPVTDDRWSGVAGVRATRNGRPVRTRPCADLGQAFMTCSNPDFMSEAERPRFAGVRQRVRYTQYGGSCFAYGVLASGRTDLGVDASLDPYDVFACIAVIEGAGGIASDWDGNPVRLGWKGRFLAAGAANMHAEVVALLAG